MPLESAQRETWTQNIVFGGSDEAADLKNSHPQARLPRPRPSQLLQLTGRKARLSGTRMNPVLGSRARIGIAPALTHERSVQVHCGGR